MNIDSFSAHHSLGYVVDDADGPEKLFLRLNFATSNIFAIITENDQRLLTDFVRLNIYLHALLRIF